MPVSWLVLMVSLPPHPSSFRVRVWRKLRALGAIQLRKSVYLLPPTPDNFERFQWLSQEVQKDGGEATFLSVDNIENMKRADVVRLFQQARDQDYRVLVERYRKVARGLDRKKAASGATRRNEELGRLARELERIRDIDFFEAPGYQEAKRLQETIEMRLHPVQANPPAAAELPLDSLSARRWVTRPRPHVDRIGSAWLIKRFIDPDAEFIFAAPKEFPPDAIPFDAAGVEFGHHGEDCTFETLVKRLGHRDRRLTHLAEIVHEVDLKDQKFPRDEARGVDLAIRGLLNTFKDDQEVLVQGMVLFDGLYAALSDRP
ncbi:MAG TPA: chromate resistance protein ChrB domain-containing protein [Methylomirabilota bacterium]|nr:chromate resistance protein ChrB domain-containing protein [Methylomirabilota bacterium]